MYRRAGRARDWSWCRRSAVGALDDEGVRQRFCRVEGGVVEGRRLREVVPVDQFLLGAEVDLPLDSPAPCGTASLDHPHKAEESQIS